MADIELKYIENGSGEPAIVFAHGFASGPEDWAAQTSHLGQRQQVIAAALRGHGISGRGATEMSMEQLATDCLELARERGAERVIFGGHSMGTRVAIEAHRQAPDRVCGLILVDGSNSTAVTDLASALAGFEAALADMGYAAFAELLFAQMFYNPELDELKQKLIKRALAVPEEIGKPLYENLIKWDGNVTRDALKAANVPILVLQSTTRDASGGRRALEPGEVGAYETLVLECAPHADVVAFPGLGHFTSLEDPDGVNAAIDQWLDKKRIAAVSGGTSFWCDQPDRTMREDGR